jgi:hypothetical protein
MLYRKFPKSEPTSVGTSVRPTGRASAQEQDENDQRNRNSDEPKQNRHGVSPFVFEG